MSEHLQEVAGTFWSSPVKVMLFFTLTQPFPHLPSSSSLPVQSLQVSDRFIFLKHFSNHYFLAQRPVKKLLILKFEFLNYMALKFCLGGFPSIKNSILSFTSFFVYLNSISTISYYFSGAYYVRHSAGSTKRPLLAPTDSPQPSLPSHHLHKHVSMSYLLHQTVRSPRAGGLSDSSCTAGHIEMLNTQLS